MSRHHFEALPRPALAFRLLERFVLFDSFHSKFSSLFPVFSQCFNSFSLYILFQDTIGFNLAGLRFIQGEMEAKQETFFTDATEKVKKIRKKHKSAVVQVVK